MLFKQARVLCMKSNAWAMIRRVLVLYPGFLFILCMSACQTLKDQDSEAKREEDLLSTQKSVVIGYINQSQPNMALRELRALLVKYPEDPDFKNLMGLTYLSLQNPKMALNYFEESYRLQPRTSVALNLSSAYIETKQLAKAMKLLKDLRASKTGKDYQYPERILHNIGLAAERMDKPKVAEKYYKLAIESNPFYYLSLMRLGQLFEKARRQPEAQKQYERAHEACMRCFDPIQALVTQQLQSGKAPAAMTLIQEYLAEKELDNADRIKARKLMATATQSDPQNGVHARTDRGEADLPRAN